MKTNQKTIQTRPPAGFFCIFARPLPRYRDLDLKFFLELFFLG